MTIPLWFIIFMREISRGATLLHPLYTHEITGQCGLLPPNFSINLLFTRFCLLF